MRVGIVGCGLIGQKRVKALLGAKLVACADLDDTNLPSVVTRCKDASLVNRSLRVFLLSKVGQMRTDGFILDW